MKVLYIGYYREKSDWGQQTANNILALDRAGVDVVCRSINLGGTETPQELLKLENKSISDCTHCIQHVFPEHMVGTDKFDKNIGYFTNNFVNINNSSWVEKLNMMDEVWVPSHLDWNNHLPERCRKNAKVVKQAVDMSVFEKRYKPIEIPEVGDDFKFYTICSLDSAKALEWVIASFHAEFDVSEKVSLIINIETYSRDGQAELNTVKEISERTKSLLRLYPDTNLYKKDVIIASPTATTEDICALHQYGDCYISSNPNVSFPLSEIHAAGFGNNPIVSDFSSVVEYIGKHNSIKSIYQIVQSKNGMWRDANNGKDFWIRPCELRLRKKMREAFEKNCTTNDKIEALQNLSNVSLENVGRLMKEALSA
jgi:hypothetical protein